LPYSNFQSDYLSKKGHPPPIENAMTAHVTRENTNAEIRAYFEAFLPSILNFFILLHPHFSFVLYDLNIEFILSLRYLIVNIFDIFAKNWCKIFNK
ncbi:MAG: hypothetical protein K2G42_06585, partial [Clostridia bacterium]|nr:hypothetical protein [Clostridia bacterium]